MTADDKHLAPIRELAGQAVLCGSRATRQITRDLARLLNCYPTASCHEIAAALRQAGRLLDLVADDDSVFAPLLYRRRITLSARGQIGVR